MYSFMPMITNRYINCIPESMHIYLYVYKNYTEIDANLHHIIYMYIDIHCS